MTLPFQNFNCAKVFVFYLAYLYPILVGYHSVKKDFRSNKKLLKASNYVKIFYLLIPVGYCSLLRRYVHRTIQMVQVLISDQYWFGLCFSD